jgi:hypothetical protein
MAANQKLYWQPTPKTIVVGSVISLLIYFMLISEVMANVNPYRGPVLNNVTSILAVNSPSGVARANLVIVPALVPSAAGPAAWTGGKILKEVGKQAVDQPGHFLIGAAPIWVSRYLVGVPWFGWVMAPILAYREWLQWPSNRWWDPPLDWVFLTLGAVAATWRRRPGQRLAGTLAALRQSAASGLAIRGRIPQAG